jgi:uncharacterized protein (TIGR02646 family)
MEKITRKPLSEIPSLLVLLQNWEQWGREYKARIDRSEGKAVSFKWRKNLYPEMLRHLREMVQDHCTFCDGFPNDTSPETIEHYEPKTLFPLIAYKWENLFYCCWKCQKEANESPFQLTLRTDASDYSFDRYFYYDNQDGEVKVMENLDPIDFENAHNYLQRYGINATARRKKVRQNEYKNVKYALSDPEDGQTRDDFPCRFVYDCVVRNQAV